MMQVQREGTPEQRSITLRSIVAVLTRNRGEAFWKSINPLYKRRLVVDVILDNKDWIPEDFTDEEIDTAIKEAEIELGW